MLLHRSEHAQQGADIVGTDAFVVHRVHRTHAVQRLQRGNAEQQRQQDAHDQHHLWRETET
ncbi:MAG: hypothetical protein OJI74_08685 [Rhodanobacter thiooxydans]|nr:hypothetical protein [Rhodanobacter thiooxydans]